MNKEILILLFCFISTVLFCQNSTNSVWKSKRSSLELVFNNQWKLIKPYLDEDEKVIVGLADQTDHSSFTVKITEDYPKAIVSDERYFNAIKEQMLNANSRNKLIEEGEVKFKEGYYYRLIFFMITKFGEMTHTVYTKRDGEKS